MTEGQYKRVENAFDAAFTRMCEAESVSELESELSNVLNQLYRLRELARKRFGDSRYYELVKGSNGLRIIRAIVWARKFDVHDTVVMAELSDMYTNYYTEMYGVLAWKPLSLLPEQTDNYDRHLDYISTLENRPVLDTTKDAFTILKELIE